MTLWSLQSTQPRSQLLQLGYPKRKGRHDSDQDKKQRQRLSHPTGTQGHAKLETENHENRRKLSRHQKRIQCPSLTSLPFICFESRLNSCAGSWIKVETPSKMPKPPEQAGASWDMKTTCCLPTSGQRHSVPRSSK